ncbi:MAG TPA: Glu/Leu/Phe/Val dehydrogenase dimerization domain-containing protein [Actinomycetota bacterium]|nr:Glu/Leu/Phe/Val dehydrogenase dimerization domain-containing protein [Actinomycetota bacterium]
MAFEELIEAWDGEEVVVHRDEPTSSWMLIGIHDTTLGPGMGGTRLSSYRQPSDALEDVLRLSEAMTWKQAAAGLPYGGGKAVIAVPEVPAPGSDGRRSLLLRYAELVESLHGTYVTAADMNTGEADMDTIGERTSHVLGRSTSNGGSGDPGAATALGLFHGIRATVLRAFGDDALEARSVLVQGLGSVGSRLAGHLHDAGATLLLADVDAERATALADALGAKVVRADDVIGTECDVFAPCATGKVLSEDTIPLLRCRAIAGAANNQLATTEDGDRLRDAGILFAPDFVVNAGGVIHLAGRETLGWDDATTASRLEAIGDSLREIFDRSDRESVSPATAADRMARERVAVARGE